MASEFPFELRVCRWAERAWPPSDDWTDDRRVLVARQLGIRERRWDTIVVETDLAGLRARARFGHDHLDELALFVLTNAPESWGYYRNVLSAPPVGWRYVRESINRAADRGILDRRKRGGRIEIRQKWPYPDWVDGLVAIENKPDLEATAASRLAEQLEFDVALSLADEVWVATAATSASVEPVLFETLPVSAGILTFQWTDRDPASVLWRPRRLRGSTGTRIRDRGSTGTHVQQAGRFEYVDADWLRTKRLAIAERAYERGWRSYIDSLRPDCRSFELATGSPTAVPHCRALDTQPTPRTCTQHCRAFEPEPPHWRTRGWPIAGGPGAGIQRLLERQRRRQRDPTE